MRCIGNIAEKSQAEHFVHFLAAQHIEAQWRALQDTGYAVWVLEEDRVATAHQQLAAFLASPDDPRFHLTRLSQPDRTSSEPRRLLYRRTDIWGGWRLAAGGWRLAA